MRNYRIKKKPVKGFKLSKVDIDLMDTPPDELVLISQLSDYQSFDKTTKPPRRALKNILFYKLVSKNN